MERLIAGSRGKRNSSCFRTEEKGARAGESVLEHGQNGPEVYRTGIDARGSRTEAPVFGTTSASRSPPRKICSWPAAVWEPPSTHVVHPTGRCSTVKTASVTRSSPGTEETRGATDNGSCCLASGGSPTRPMTPATATSLPR
ncbi:hypothetical protein HPB50_009721 [Hyalomma asiaticum]|uniref:Uncharacterized protein n=1 Tax=Hyalomma asiaticum TaxID=266040 RepID=A0ACB7THY4_HYAAI|nr:hypothetical protein HPB50_009721 [Hyalomma asiaticum]